jgi:hypothetical protein
MRKLVGLAVTVATLGGAGVALAGQSATSRNGEFVDVHVAVSPPVAGSAKTPRGVGLSIDSFTGNRVDGDTPSDNTGTVLRFNRGFKENGALFPACRLNPIALSTCSKSDQIGKGSAELAMLGTGTTPPTFAPATLSVYNGSPLPGAATPTIILIARVAGQPPTEVDFTAGQQPSGRYGLAFDEIVFQSPSSSPAGFQITKFSFRIPDRSVTLRVNGKSVKVHFLVAPTTCGGSWQFAQTNTYSNATRQTATDSEPCVNALKRKR